MLGGDDGTLTADYAPGSVLCDLGLSLLPQGGCLIFHLFLLFVSQRRSYHEGFSSRGLTSACDWLSCTKELLALYLPEALHHQALLSIGE